MFLRNKGAARLLVSAVIALCLAMASAAVSADPAFAVSDAAFQKAKVQNLTVKMVDDTRLKISYDAYKGSGGYEIFRAPKKAGKYKLIRAVRASKTAFKDTGLKAQKKYFYKVRAYREVSGRVIYSKYSAIRYGTTDFAGNAAEYDVSKVKTIKDSPLKDLNVVFLGSSITLGKGSRNQSFADYLAKRHGLNAIKLAKSGTTMAIRTDKTDSYIERLQEYINTGAAAPDYLVCQLGSNDARYQLKIGNVDSVAEHTLADLNTKSVTGAIEYISGYAQEAWGCPVIFFVMPQFESDEFHDDHYVKMRDALYRVKDLEYSKWGGDRISILDMWVNESLNRRLTKKWKLFMTDEIHPTKAGYLDVYTPEFESYLQTAMANEIADAIAEEELGEELDESMEIQLP